MQIQSLSVVVPTNNTCVNKCPFCVSRTHGNLYKDRISAIVKNWNNVDEDWHIKNTIEYKDYFNRLQDARDKGCNVVILTGTGEPLQNMHFLQFFSNINKKLTTPFKSIELQTTGVLLTKKDEFESRKKMYKLRELGITTLSFSVSNLMDNDRNLEIIGCPDNLKFDLENVIKLALEFDFNIRLSLNLVKDYDNYYVNTILDKCKSLGAHQVTFRKLYKSETNTDIDHWIEWNASTEFYPAVHRYVKNRGKLIGMLPVGPKIFDIDEMSIVIDGDCMSEEVQDNYKYLVLRENCKLYNKWDTKASLIF